MAAASAKPPPSSTPTSRTQGTWPYKHDVEHFDSLPVRSPGLLFTGLACHQPEYIALWKQLNPDPTDPEIIRNYPSPPASALV